MEIKINGIKYRPKEQPKRKQMSKTFMTMMVMAEMYYGRSKQKENSKVDIIKEYELIQQKKSNLSKSGRDWVVWQFEKNFERV